MAWLWTHLSSTECLEACGQDGRFGTQIAAAEARRYAAVARVSAEQLNLAAELAQMTYMVREADRMIEYIDQKALPNFERMIAAAEAGYQSGAGGPSMLAEARHMPFLMKLERLEALRQRETAVVDLLLLIADVAPSGAPVLATASASPADLG